MEKVAISKIKENPDNPRKIDKEAYEKLVNSIKEFPKMLEIRPLVVDKNMVVIGGNMRLKALKELQYTEVPIIRADKLTDDEIKRFVVVDNLPYGKWDYDFLANQYGIKDLENWGFDTKDLGMLLDEPDDLVGELKNKPFVIKITLKSEKEMQDLKAEIDRLLENYTGVEVSISGGEL